MTLSQKCYYALRAVFELARAGSGQPVRSGDIASRQNIPAKFLEAILVQLKGGGFVESRRGSAGGYVLARPASTLTVGEIIRFVEGPLSPTRCEEDRGGCGAARSDCVFRPIWQEAENALSAVYDGVTFQDLVDRSRPEQQIPDYVI